MSTKPPTSEPLSVEQTLYNLAMDCDVCVMREDGQSLDAFAEDVKAAIREKIDELSSTIEDIDTLDTTEAEEDA